MFRKINIQARDSAGRVLPIACRQTTCRSCCFHGSLGAAAGAALEARVAPMGDPMGLRAALQWFAIPTCGKVGARVRESEFETELKPQTYVIRRRATRGRVQNCRREPPPPPPQSRAALRRLPTLDLAIVAAAPVAPQSSGTMRLHTRAEPPRRRLRLARSASGGGDDDAHTRRCEGAKNDAADGEIESPKRRGFGRKWAASWAWSKGPSRRVASHSLNAFYRPHSIRLPFYALEKRRAAKAAKAAVVAATASAAVAGADFRRRLECAR